MLQEPLTGRKSVKEFWRAARVIGPRNAHEPVDALYLPGQSSHCAVWGIRVMQCAGAKVADHKTRDGVDEVVLVRQSFEETSRRGLSFRFVAARCDSSEVIGSRRRLSEVMTEDGKTHDEIVVVMVGAFCGEPVQAVECVDPDIAFRVPDGILLAAL
jgi:hypothetical protein